MEDLDRNIIALLSADGRMSYTDLGKATGLSTSAAHQRVRRLEERGIIVGYRAVVDPNAVGLPMTAIIALSPIDPAAPDDIPDRLAEVHAIESCWSVAGSDSYLVQVRVASPNDLESLIAVVRSAANCTTRTIIVLSTPWEQRPIVRVEPVAEESRTRR